MDLTLLGNRIRVAREKKGMPHFCFEIHRAKPTNYLVVTWADHPHRPFLFDAGKNSIKKAPTVSDRRFAA